MFIRLFSPENKSQDKVEESRGIKRKNPTENKEEEDFQKDNRIENCAICAHPHGTHGDKVEMACGHKFCRGCVFELVVKSDSDDDPIKCPLCREPYIRSDFKEILGTQYSNLFDEHMDTKLLLMDNHPFDCTVNFDDGVPYTCSLVSKSPLLNFRSDICKFGLSCEVPLGIEDPDDGAVVYKPVIARLSHPWCTPDEIIVVHFQMRITGNPYKHVFELVQHSVFRYCTTSQVVTNSSQTLPVKERKLSLVEHSNVFRLEKRARRN
jgi:hypothetical protein